MTPGDFSLDDKFLKEEGRIVLSGLQALVRIPLDQHRADRGVGLNTASFISGYRGSPLGGLDILLARNKKLLDRHQVVFMPGVNEDLGATAVFGSQLANLMPEPKYDGVLGMWYGKGPGVDRSGDIFKHANFAGVGRHGGVLAVAGDDPISKSSTLPTHSEVALFDARMPILYPGNAREVIEYGRYGFELSRYCGCWVGFKIVTDVADGFSTVDVSPIADVKRPDFTFNGQSWQHLQTPALLAPFSLQMEREIQLCRLEAARLFASENHLNQITVSSPQDRIGLVAAGKTYYDLHQALGKLGLTDDDLRRYGIRLLKVGMIHPLEPALIREFARGLVEVFLVEEKRAFVELFLRDELYNLPDRPLILGKKDETGQFLFPAYDELDADSIARILAPRLAEKLPRGRLSVAGLERQSLSALPALPAEADRSPYFCSGCPHNRSTVVPEGSVAGGGIGCHAMVLRMSRNTQGITHMGGEGVQWVGASPFSGVSHMFQNLGDGTFFHSGHLAVRQAVAAETNITYKILYNSAVAMTGGQPVDGAMSVPALTRVLEAEGVGKTIVCSHDLLKYPSHQRWAKDVQVWDRDRLEEAQRLLREEPGVTALIYDQPCAAEQRRKRKRGEVETPSRRVLINEAVCEGCGDCGVQSNCLSVFPVETEYGRKTRIDQSSCNLDYSCLNGDCPAFVTITLPAGASRVEPPPAAIQRDFEQPLPEPDLRVSADASLYLTGIGGTGVVTVTQILSTAALLEGKHVLSLDQTGLSQMGGPVVSHLKIADKARSVSSKIGVGDADSYIVFDVLTGSTDQNLARARPGETIAVVSTSQVPTGGMVNSTEVEFPQWNCIRDRIESVTLPTANVYLDARGLAERLFGNHMPANLITVGAAFQAGAIPIRAASIERAIELNGIAVEANKQAFRAGRLAAADPGWIRAQTPPRAGALDDEPALTAEARAVVEEAEANGELRRLLEVRVPELIDYQNRGYAADYVQFVKRVLEAEGGLARKETPLTLAVARFLFKLMAYKDEYEVARLYRKAAFKRVVSSQFGEDAHMKYMLHPPFLRALGVKKKIAFGRWFEPGLWLLARLKGLRGSRLDVFGRGQVRRTERQLIQEYRSIIEAELEDLSVTTIDRATEIARLPDLIRGYEQIKLDSVSRFREEVRRLKGSEH